MTQESYLLDIDELGQTPTVVEALTENQSQRSAGQSANLPVTPVGIIADPGAPVGGAAPTITNFRPPVGTTLGRKQAIGFDVKDDIAVKRGMVLVTMGSEMLVVHDGDTFRGRFSGSRVIVNAAFHQFDNVTYAPGWLAAPTFEFLVTDDAGQEAV